MAEFLSELEDGASRRVLTAEDMRKNARIEREAKELEKVGAKNSENGTVLTLADVRAAARRQRQQQARRQLRHSGESNDSFRSTQSSERSYSSTLSTNSQASVERFEALPLTERCAKAILVATQRLAVRAEASLSAPLRSVLNGGSTVIVLEDCALEDSTRRALVAKLGHQDPVGWVSWVLSDGTCCLVPREAAFRQRLAGATVNALEHERKANDRRRFARMIMQQRELELQQKLAIAAKLRGPVQAAWKDTSVTPPFRVLPPQQDAAPPVATAAQPEKPERSARLVRKAGRPARDDDADDAQTPPKLRREVRDGTADDSITPPKMRRARDESDASA